MFIEHLEHALLHALPDTLRLLPFLYLTYLLMELLERRASEKTEALIRRSGKAGPLIGGLLGAVPQCGFSAAGASLYAGRILTPGTLLAIFLSTSDEMLPVMVSSGASPLLIVKIVGIKVAVGVLAGLAVDAVHRKWNKGKLEQPHIEEICQKGRCHCDEHSIWISALIHTAQVALTVFLVAFALNLLLEVVGEEILTRILTLSPLLSCLLSALVGLIPNCASSVAITTLYLEGILSAGAMLSGLLVNAGVGLLVLFRVNRPHKDSLRLVALLFAIGIAVGVAVQALSLASVLGI